MTTSDTATVEVRVPADSEFVSTLRLTAASLAARCDLTVDEIEDLRLALDEACALLLPHAVDGSALEVEFSLAPGSIEVTARVEAAESSAPERSGFGWAVLSALASEVAVQHEDGRLAI